MEHIDEAPQPVIAANDDRAVRRDAIRSENSARKSQPTDRQDPRREARRPHKRKEEDDDVLGFGNDMPAFMMVAGKV